MGLDFLKGLFRASPDVSTLSAMRLGTVVAAGKVKAGPETIRSPVKGVPCVAFHYRAFYYVEGRTGWLERSLKAVEVHAPLYFLELDGGTVKVVARKSDRFSNIDHREIAARGFPRFKAEEQIVRPGARVRIKGRAFREGDAWVLDPRQVWLVAEPERPATAIKAASRRRPARP